MFETSNDLSPTRVSQRLTCSTNTLQMPSICNCRRSKRIGASGVRTLSVCMICLIVWPLRRASFPT